MEKMEAIMGKKMTVFVHNVLTHLYSHKQSQNTK